MAFTFLPSLNYPGSSGYDANGKPISSTIGSGSGSGVQNPGQLYYDSGKGAYTMGIGGNPFTGNFGGNSYQNGQKTPAYSPPPPTGNPNQDYQPVSISKNPALSSELETMQKQFDTAANSALQGYPAAAKQFGTDLNTARTAAATAENITPTVNALTSAQQGYTQQLQGAQQAYQQALAQSSGAQLGTIAQEQANLPQYDQAVQTVANMQQAALGPQMAKYAEASGVPTGASGAQQEILAKSVGEIQAPTQLAKINAEQGILANQLLPTQSRIGQENIAYAGNFLPSTAAAQYQSGTQLATTVQGLKQSVAGMTMQNAVAFMQAQGVPLQVQAQILGTNIQQLQSLASLYPQSYYQGLNYVPGNQLSLVQGFNNSTPPIPSVPARAPNLSGPAGGPAGGAGSGGGAVLNPGGNNPLTGYPSSPSSVATGASTQQQGIAQGQSYYDPTTGMVVNPDGSYSQGSVGSATGQSYYDPSADYGGY